MSNDVSEECSLCASVQPGKLKDGAMERAYFISQHTIISRFVRFQVLTAACMMMIAFWDIAPCSLPTFQTCVLPPIPAMT
jgi:hypothetical protein